ncbi:MAG TPA: class I SAM-dependent methyltransferase [Bryobacteraceae bacterium]|jgi:SAM-dependent methyltransferase
MDNSLFWDLKYEEGLPSLTKPDPFFLAAYETFVFPSFPNAGTALDVAAGLGRHALWLAGKNWQVTAVDVSPVAMGKVRRAARELNLTLDVFAVDAAQYEFGLARFDLIVLFYHFDRRLFREIISALRPGGLVICKMALSWSSEIAPKAKGEDVLTRNELMSLLTGLDVVAHEERPIRDRGVVEFVGRKPLA